MSNKINTLKDTVQESIGVDESHISEISIKINRPLNSTIMASLCYLNTMSYGLDYPQFIHKSLTQGQQADIQLVMDYLKKVYQ